MRLWQENRSISYTGISLILNMIICLMIVTNMPVRGKMTREQLDRLYEKFFRKALTILEKEAVIVMYTGEIGFVKKQLRLHREFSLLEEYCMQSKAGCYNYRSKEVMA